MQSEQISDGKLFQTAIFSLDSRDLSQDFILLRYVTTGFDLGLG